MSWELQEISLLKKAIALLEAKVAELEKHSPMLASIANDWDAHQEALAQAAAERDSIQQSQTGSGVQSPDTPATNS